MQFHSKSANAVARVLSNFHPMPTGVVYRIPRASEDVIPKALWDRSAPTVEHAFQAVKIALVDEQHPLLERILDERTTTASGARTLGGQRSFRKSGLCLDMARWNAVSGDVMRALVKARYVVDHTFRNALAVALKQGVPLHFERSGARSKWGGHFEKATGEWRGANELGKILYDVGKMYM